MKSSNAPVRQQHIIDDASIPEVDLDTARAIASAWMDIVAAETHLERMGVGILPWRAAPAAQNALASILSDQITGDVKVMCVNLQPYGWMSAAGQSVTDILRIYLGKIFVRNVLHVSAQDCAAVMKKGAMNIVALHAESVNDWNDVRALSAAAVKTGTPMLMLVSAGMSAPESVAIDRVLDWTNAAVQVREACEQVKSQGAIRVIAMDDVNSAAMEMAMMGAARVAPAEWQNSIQENNDGAEMAANAAYQSPVESF